MAPINLPDGSQVSEIVLPDGSTASEVLAPDGSAVFGNAIPDSLIDNFEDSDAEPVGRYGSGEDLTTYYNGTGTGASGYNRNTNLVAEGQYGLQFTNAGAAIFSHPGDGLPNYPDEGDTVSWLAQDSSGGDSPTALFHVEDGSSDPDCYGFLMNKNATGKMEIRHITSLPNFNSSTLADSSNNQKQETYYWNQVSLKTQSDPTLTYELYELNNDLTRGSLIDSISASDTSTPATNRGIGWYNINGSIQGVGGSYFDRMKIE